MSRYNPHHPHAERLLQAAERWRDRCLIGQRSLFTDEKLWRAELLAEVRHAFVDNPLETDERFMDKLRQQFAKASPEAVRLLAEIYWVLNLFPSNMGGELKRNQVQEIWSWSGASLPEDHPLLDTDMLSGIGSGGMGFLAHRWRELRYLMNLLAAWIELTEADRRSILEDPWRFAEWVENIPDEGYRQLRHILPFLLFPDTFERIASPTHIRRILEKLGEIDRREVGRMTKLDQDRALLALRERLETEKGALIDFYHDDLEGRWREKSDAGISVGAAEELLAQSFARTNTTDKIASFETPAGLPIALDRKSRNVQIWVTPPVPEIDGIALKRHFEAEESRNSNLPEGLRRGREVLLLTASTTAGLEDLIDALRGEDHASVDEVAFDRLAEKFLSYMPDFSTFDVDYGKYFENERDYKDDFAELFTEMAGPYLEQPIDSESRAVEVVNAVHAAMTSRLLKNPVAVCAAA